MYIKCFHPPLLIQTKSSLILKAFIEMNIDDWELLYNKCSHTTVQELFFPSDVMEEEKLSLGSNIEQQSLNAIQQPNFLATEVESYDEVVEEVEEDEQHQIFSYEEQIVDNKEDDEEVTDNKLVGTLEDMDGKSESLSFMEESGEEEEVGEMVEYTGPESKQKSVCNAFRLRNLLRSVGLAAATFSIFILQKSMPKNQKIEFKICKNEKATQLLQHQQEVSEPLAAKAHCSFGGRYDDWY